MDVTFFYGSQRIMTSAVDKNGDRILGSPAGDKVVEKVLNGGEEYFRQSVRQLMQQQMQQERKLTGSHLLQRALEVQRVMRQQEAQMDRQLQVMHHSLSVILMYTVEPV